MLALVHIIINIFTNVKDVKIVHATIFKVIYRKGEHGMDYIRRMRDLREDADMTCAQVAAILGTHPRQCTPAMSAA